jgi:hypothetical protein
MGDDDGRQEASLGVVGFVCSYLTRLSTDPRHLS